MMLTVLTYNILNGGRAREEALHTIITAVRPDIVLLQELLDPGLLTSLARSLQADSFFAHGNSRFHLGLISRYPILTAHSYHQLPIRTTLLEASIALPSQQPLHLWGVHLMPHLTIPFELWRVAEVRTLLRRTRRIQDAPCLVAGDFNAIAPRERVLVHALPPALQWAVLAQGGRVYPWALAQMTKQGWLDCYRQMHPQTTGWALPSQRPNARLDYVFVNSILAPHLCDCSIVTTPALVQTASDHLPVKAVFSLD
jgi:endonuclease/exonuclease/phosphatase family metal-dependent hydrolase